MCKKLLMVLLSCLLTLPLSIQAGFVPLPFDDDTAYGRVPIREGYLSENEYKDESIHVQVERFDYQGTECMFIKIDIAHPSQIRTTKSSPSFTDKEMVVATLMAKKARAVFGINGDFFKYNVQGYTIRQQQVVKKRLQLAAAEKYDVLFIDQHGNFSFTKNATTETAQAHQDQLEQAGLEVINSFTFGPVLVENGVVQDFNQQLWHGAYPMQRVAIAQLGPLSYGVFHCGGATQLKTGLTLQAFAEMIAAKQPDVLLAYNLDGGGSTNLVFDNQKINANWDVREICDMLYFASLEPVSGPGQ